MMYNSALFYTTLLPHLNHVLTANNTAASDLQTREIFGLGTKNGGLYYVDDVTTSRPWELAVFLSDDSYSMLPIKGVLHETTCPQIPQQNGVAECKNGRNRGVPLDHYSPEDKARYAISHYMSDHRLSLECKAFVTRIDSINISTCVDKAFNNPKWTEAVNTEIEALQKNNTWDDVELPKGTKLIGCRWVFTVKYNADCTMKRFTAAMKKFGYQQADTDHTLFIKHRAGKYVMDLLADNGMLDCKPADTPIVENHKLGVYMDQDHMATVMHILSYLKSASRRGLLFKKNGHLNLEGYTNTDYAGNITNRRSTLGYFTFVGGNLVHDVARSKMLCLGPLQSLSTEELPKEFVKCCG
ncbi:unnamed protein product [Prunus armeniaca]